MKKIGLLLLLCCLSFAVNAEIKIGTPIFDPPYTLQDPKVGLSGYDADLIGRICKILQWDCKYIPMDHSTLLQALLDKKIDYAIGALVITPERETEFLFTVPYLPCEGGFLVKIDSPIKVVSDLDGKKIGSMAGRAYLSYAQENFNTMTLIPYKSYSKLALDFEHDDIDAVFMNYLTALDLVYQYPDKIRVLDTRFKVGYGMGIASLPVNRAGIDQMNQILLKFQSDGTFIKLYNYYFEFFIPQTTPKK